MFRMYLTTIFVGWGVAQSRTGPAQGLDRPKDSTSPKLTPLGIEPGYPFTALPRMLPLLERSTELDMICKFIYFGDVKKLMLKYNLNGYLGNQLLPHMRSKNRSRKMKGNFLPSTRQPLSKQCTQHWEPRYSHYGKEIDIVESCNDIVRYLKRIRNATSTDWTRILIWRVRRWH